MRRRRDPQARYNEIIRKQQWALEDFVAQELEWADHLLMYYRVTKKDMPDNEYRACAFFKNKEYLNKPGALSLLYTMYKRCIDELPSPTKENCVDLLAFRYRMYAKVLMNWGFS